MLVQSVSGEGDGAYSEHNPGQESSINLRGFCLDGIIAYQATEGTITQGWRHFEDKIVAVKRSLF